MEKVLVTPRSLSKDGHPALDALKDAGLEVVFVSPGLQPSEAQLLDVLPGCCAYLAGVEPVGGDLLRRCSKLKVISRNGVGVDNVDLAAAAEMGIVVEKAIGTNSRGVAELAVSLMLSGVRSIPSSSDGIKAGGWQRRKGFEVEGKTLGIIGCGQIGRYVAKMAGGLGMKVIAYDLFPDEGFSPEGFRYGSLDEIYSAADIISLHCPPGDTPLIDAASISKMKEGVFIVNTARAGLVDDEAVIAALDSGRLFGYATDVFKKEPPEPSDLIDHARVITTPHIGGFTNESVDRATEAAVDNILKVLNGK